MRFITLLPAFLASILVSASPDIENHLDHLAQDEIHVYKRDSVITARDVELAERDGVDLNEMYRHSIIKRDDGNHVTVWVANGYVGEEAVPESAKAEKRQSLRVGSQDSWRPNSPDRSFCKWETFVGDTGPNAPFTGGANAIVNWANGRNGYWFFIQPEGPKPYKNLVVAGSDRGFNMRFTVQQRSSVKRGDIAYIGVGDVGHVTRTARDRYEQNHGGWRVRARGEYGYCRLESNGCFKNICVPLPGGLAFNWWIDNWDRPVHK